MRCDVCGLENAANLTYCQDCGRRLSAPARVVPPTPPIGLTKVELPAQADPMDGLDAELSREPDRSATSTRSRPEAPLFSFSPPAPAGAAVEETAPAARTEEAAPGPAGVRCTVCETTNPGGYRFCVCCGARLDRGSVVPASAAAPAAARPPAAASSESADTERQAMITRAVVDLSTTQVDAPRLVRCERCQGMCLEGTHFCKYCGASLEAAAGRASELPQEPLRTRPSRPPAEPAPGLAPAVMPATRTASSEGVAEPTGRLIRVEESGAAGTIYALSGEQMDIGRTEGDILLAGDPYVSPRHARLLRAQGGWVLRDLASTNKVFVRIRKPTTLHDGDLLIMGLEVLQFDAVSESERELGHASENGTLIFGSAAKPCYARLRQRTVEGITRDVHHLTEPDTVIGRENADIVFTADPFLSRRHAVIRRSATTGHFTISDLESSHGVFIAIREDTPLASGDQLRIGQHLFRTELG